MPAWNAGWSLGVYCNAGCAHCYSSRARRSGNELTLADIDRVIGQLERLGVRTLNLGGNEPIFTNGRNIEATTLPYVVLRAVRRGIDVGITTNSTTCVYLCRERFEAWDAVNDWDLSIDSPFESEHDGNRRAKLWNQVLRAADLCTAHGKPKSFVMVAMNWNLTRRHLDELLKLAAKHKAEIRVNTLKPLERRHFSLMPTAGQIYGAFGYLLDRCETSVMGESLLASLCGMTAPKGCPCGSESFRISSKTAAGTIPITPCVYLNDQVTGDLLTEDLVDSVQAESFASFRRRRETRLDFCRDGSCGYWDTCRGGCAARAYLFGGGFDRPDPYCPKLLEKAGFKPPAFRSAEAGHTGLRVHENYLCTWIGRVRQAGASEEVAAGSEG
jgi:radical SAM protein with 4Fe4S-binding SPASM domain